MYHGDMNEKTMLGTTHGKERGGKGKMAMNQTSTGTLQIFSRPVAVGSDQ